jgi:hypothetical protein
MFILKVRLCRNRSFSRFQLFGNGLSPAAECFLIIGGLAPRIGDRIKCALNLGCHEFGYQYSLSRFSEER